MCIIFASDCISLAASAVACSIASAGDERAKENTECIEGSLVCFHCLQLRKLEASIPLGKTQRLGRPAEVVVPAHVSFVLLTCSVFANTT